MVGLDQGVTETEQDGQSVSHQFWTFEGQFVIIARAGCEGTVIEVAVCILLA